jgi:hypothetical protein
MEVTLKILQIFISLNILLLRVHKAPHLNIKVVSSLYPKDNL